MHIEHTTHDAVRRRQLSHPCFSSSLGHKGKVFSYRGLSRGAIQQTGTSSSTARSTLRGDSMSGIGTEIAPRPVTLWPSIPGKANRNEEEGRGTIGIEEKKKQKKKMGDDIIGRRNGHTDGRNRSIRWETDTQSPSSQQWSVPTVLQQRSSLRRSRSKRHSHNREPFRDESRRSERAKSESRPPSNHHYSIYPFPPRTPSPLHSSEPPRGNGTTRDPLSASSSCRGKLFPEIKDKYRDKDKEKEKLFQGQDQRRREHLEGATQHRTSVLKGKNLWRVGPLHLCRLCKACSVEGIRGLCHQCESDFVRPETMVVDRDLHTTRPWSRSEKYDFKDDEDGDKGDSEEEVKLPVPLKDKRTQKVAVKMRRDGKEKGIAEVGSFGTGNWERDGSILDAAPDLNSVTGKIDGRYWDGQDQALFMAREKEKTQRIIRGWGVKQEKRERRSEKEEKKRRTSFYRFWDDIL